MLQRGNVSNLNEAGGEETHLMIYSLYFHIVVVVAKKLDLLVDCLIDLTTDKQCTYLCNKC